MTNYPDFYDAAPVITLYDPLAEFLGATERGVMEYHYLDIVMLAGHSCPTVACAYLMTRAALRVLYPDELPVRGEIRVDLRDDIATGTSGVQANVVSFITGAAGAGGFKGIGGRFNRDGMLAFNSCMDGDIRFTRTDTGAAVEASSNPGFVAAEPGIHELMKINFSDRATEGQKTALHTLWQTRVRKLLLEHVDDPALISIRVFTPPSVKTGNKVLDGLIKTV
jgi:hypothetical protein